MLRKAKLKNLALKTQIFRVGDRETTQIWLNRTLNHLSLSYSLEPPLVLFQVYSSNNVIHLITLIFENERREDKFSLNFVRYNQNIKPSPL